MKFEKVYFIVLLVLMIILNYSNLNLPYHWDDFNYVIPAADHVFQNKPSIFLWEYGLGHPPFFYIFSGLIFKILGDSTFVAHSIILTFSFLTILFTYLIGKELFSRKTGILASMLLLFTPIFVSYSSLFYLEAPLTAFTLIAIYFSIKNKPYLSILFGSLAVLTKELGIVITFGIFLTNLILNRTKKSLIYLFPVFIFLLTIILNKIYYGYLIYPISSSLINIDPIKNVIISMAVLKNIFFDQFRWILTSLIVLSLIHKNSFKKNKKHLFFSSIASIGLLILIFSLKLLNLNIYFPNINNYLLLLQRFSILIVILFFILTINLKEFFNFYLKKRLTYIYIQFLLIVGVHFLIIPFVQRYILPAYPLIFLLFASSVNRIFKKYSYLIALIFIILSISLLTGNRSVVGFALEDNLEYKDFIKVRQLGASYLELNFQNSTVLTTFPLSSDLQYPYGKYVTNPLKLITMEPHPGIIYKNYTQFINPETIPKKEINLSEIDIYYHSPQEFPNEKLYNIAAQLDLNLIKRFELNNKSVEIYLVNRS